MTLSLVSALALGGVLTWGAVFALAGALVWAGVASGLVVVSDIRYRVIPNRVMVPALIGVPALLALAVLLTAGQPGAPGIAQAMDGAALLDGFLGGTILAAVHFALAMAGGLGGGDVKLALLLGILLGTLGGWPAVWWGGVLAWGCAGIAVLVQRVARAPCSTDGIPFAPCLAAGSWAVVLTVLLTDESPVFVSVVSAGLRAANE